MNLNSQPALKSDDGEETVTPVRPGPGRPRRDQVELRNAELLDHALDLFLERGFERTTIDAIAASVGMAKRTVYARYGDKATLFKAALQRAIDNMVVPVEQLRAAERDGVEACLLSIARILVANLMSREGLRLMRITNSESYRMPEIGAYTYDRGTRITINYLADLFRRLKRAEGEKMPEAEAEDAAEAFLNLLGSPARTTAWGMEVDQTEIDRQTRYRVGLFVHGVFSS
jgi:TetR/AcrR family transcriptional regulator, mexJK operon transcriptional repressor